MISILMCGVVSLNIGATLQYKLLYTPMSLYSWAKLPRQRGKAKNLKKLGGNWVQIPSSNYSPCCQ